jgi:hypothetical protein
VTNASVLYGPDSLAYETYDPVSPAPGAGFEGCNISQRGRYPLGTQLVSPDGRKFRFFLNGGTLGVVGDVAQTAVVVTTDVDLTPTTPTATLNAAGARYLSFTHGAGTAVINQYAEGYAVISAAPGGGHTYKIAAHAALTSGGTGEIVYFAPGHQLRETLTTSSDIDLVPHPYAGNIQCAATITGAPVGVYVTATPASDFGWLATRGVCGVLTAGTLTIGSPAVMLLSGGTAGAVAPATAATQPQVGLVQRLAGTSAEFSSIFLTIDG